MTDPNKFTPAERRQHDAALRHRHTIRLFLNGDPNATPPKAAFTEHLIADLIRRAREEATNDGYGRGGETERHGNDISDPTLAAVIRGETWKQPPDHVRTAIWDILGALAEAAGVLALAEKRLAYINSIPTGRVNSLAGSCQACLRDVAGGVADPLRSGYCDACRKAWDRAGKPDRPTFERQRRERQAS